MLFVRRLDAGGAQLWSNGALSLTPTGAQFSEPCEDVAVLPGPGVALVAKNTIDGVTGVAVADAVVIDVQSGAILWSLPFDLDDYEVQRIGVDVANDRFLLTGRRDTFVWFTALDAVTGQTVWTYEHPTQDTASEITELDLSKDGQVLGVAGSARMTTPFRAAFALLLDSEEAVLGHAESMTWRGVHPDVRRVRKQYSTGKSLADKEMAKLEDRLERWAGLGKWFVDISWQ